MTDYTRINLKQDVEDMAASHGLSPGLESRFAREPLGLEKSGVGYFKIAPNFRTPFGHRHGEQEEVYVVVDGSARIKLDDEIVDLAEWDMIRVPGPVTRCLEGGPDGCEVVVLGAPNTHNKDAEIIPGWWTG